MKRLKLNIQLFAEGEAINMGVLRVDAEMNATKFREGVKQVEQQLDSLSSSVDKSFGKLSQPYKTESGRLNGLKRAITNVKNAYDQLSKSAQKLGDNTKIKSKGFESSLTNLLANSKTKLSALGFDKYMDLKDPQQLARILKELETQFTRLRDKTITEMGKQADAYDKLDEKAQREYDKEMARREKEIEKIRQAAEAEEYRQSVLQRFKNIGSSGLANTFFQKAYAESIAQVTDETVKEAVETRIFNAVLAEEEQKISKEIMVRKKLAQIIEQNSTAYGKFKTIIQGVNAVQDGISKGFSTFVQRLKSAAVTYRIIGGVIRQVWSRLSSMFEEAAAYTESVNLYTVALGEYAEQGTKWANKISKALYLDPKDIMQYTGAFYNLVQGLGVASDKAYTMATNLTQLTYDMSSYLNMDVESAQAKIQSAITGQARAVASAGVAMQVASLQELAYSMGIKKSVSEMTQAEKTYLRYIQIMRSTTNMQGDLARTIITPANAVRVLKNQFTLLARAIGNVFVPIIMKAIPYVMALTKILQDLATRIASFLGVKIGWSSSEIDYSGLQLADTYLEDVGNSASSAGSKIKKAADELGNLASFDELNVITFNDDTSGGSGRVGGGGGGSVLPQLEEAISGYDMLENLTQQFDKQVKNATENLDKFKKVLEVVFGIFVAWKTLKFAGDMIALIDKIKAGSTAMGGLGSVASLVFKSFKTGNGTLTSTVQILSSVLKLVGGITLSLASMSIEYSNVNKQATDYLKTGKEMSALIPTLGVIGGAVGGAVAGSVLGPYGMIAGAVVGGYETMKSAVRGAEDAIRRVNLEAELFGNLSIPLDKWTQMFNSLRSSANEFSNSLYSVNTSIEEHSNQITKAQQDLDILSHTYSLTGRKISEEDAVKIMNSLETITSETISLIDDNTKKGLLLWGEMFKNSKNFTLEEQNEILNNLINYGERQKTAIKEAQNNITTTYNNAIKARGYLTDEEYKYIKTQLEKIRELTQQEMSKNQAKVEYYKQLFEDKNKKLDAQSYKDFLQAYKDSKQEQLDILDDTLTQQLNLNQAMYGKDSENFKLYGDESLATLEKMNQDAYDERERAGEELEQQMGSIYEQVMGNIYAKYGELLTETDNTTTKQREELENIFEEFGIPQDQIDRVKAQYKKAGEDANDSFASGLNYKDLIIKVLFKGDASDLGKAIGDELKKELKEYNLDTGVSSVIKGGTSTAVKAGASAAISSLWSKIKGHAEGGYPTSGDLFYANENGVPEYITSIGNKSAVVNQQQMVTALTNAIVQGLSNMNTPQSNEPVNIYIGNDKVYSGFINYAKRQNNIYGTNVIRV